MDWAKTTARRDQNHLSFVVWCNLYQIFYSVLYFQFHVYTWKCAPVCKLYCSDNSLRICFTKGIPIMFQSMLTILISQNLLRLQFEMFQSKYNMLYEKFRRPEDQCWNNVNWNGKCIWNHVVLFLFCFCLFLVVVFSDWISLPYGGNFWTTNNTVFQEQIVTN